MATALEDRAVKLIAEMEARLAEYSASPNRFVLSAISVGADGDKSVECAGNQHTCKPQVYLPALGQRYQLELRGTGDADIVGEHTGPRALVWRDTVLRGVHPELGEVSVHLEPTQPQAGVMMPLIAGASFPALNRNTYHFVFRIPAVGEIISDRPAFVEAIVDDVPPTASYVFRNGPLNFHLRSDPTRTTVAVLEAAVTDVEPSRPTV